MKSFLALSRVEAPQGFWWWHAGSEGTSGV